MAGTLSNTLLHHRFKLLFPLSSLPTKLTNLPILRRIHIPKKLQFRFFNSSLSSNSYTTQFNSHKTQMKSVENGDNLVVLGIETSCDDTAVTIVRGDGEILSQVVSSQTYHRSKTFGADQFDEEDPEECRSKTLFFSYFYVALNMGSLIGETILVYIETMGDWVLGFWISTGCGIAALILLFSGTMKYMHFKPSGNSISRFFQVIVASFRNFSLEVPQHGEGLYEVHGKKRIVINSARKLLHSNGFKFLDKAAIVTPVDTTFLPEKSSPTNPWRLCTVTQVEEVKCILRLLPIWLCTILSSVFIQMMSLFIEQGAAMNTVIGAFHFPPASMTAFDIIGTSTFIIFYDKLIVPLYVKLTKKKPKPPSELQRIGIGLSIAVVAIIVAGLLEQQRRKYALLSGTDTSPLSIFWQTPQFVLVGIAEAFVYVAQWEFFSSQTPDGIKSIGLGLSMSSSAFSPQRMASRGGCLPT